MRKGFLLVAILVLCVLLIAGCGPKSEPGEETKPKIIIGSKNFTEQLIVGHMVGLLMEDAGYPVEYQLRLGGSGLVHEALVNGDINVYVEYTGTGLMVMLEEDVISDPDEAYAKVKELYKEKWNLVWLEPWGFNNTYTITMHKDKAQELGVKKISDLKDKAADLVIGATHEFIPRQDGLAGLQETYGFEFKEAMGMDEGLMYQAVKEGELDVISAFATDGRIPAFELVNLEDDLAYFPPYYAAPVVRGDLLEEDPEVANILNKLAGKIDDATMAQLNYEVDENKKDPSAVAKQFLQENGYIE
ncbi:MAG TPA: glycine betaine ABC transporter substrate-binding protein [Bacillota bacterium]|jgi:glycine betaine/choline ABC-type transport system substrate-binding protein|nr:glycine betaine ABC transporter substrate-binding protein [Bacillota bacterium]